MITKIRYPRTTFEICDATLALVRDGLKIILYGDYPEMTCYNGRRWVEETEMSKRHLSLYYTKLVVLGDQPELVWTGAKAGIREFDIRIAIVRSSSQPSNQGFPFFWCTVWYKVSDVLCRFSEPASYDNQEILRRYLQVARWGGAGDKVSEFDPTVHFPELSLFYLDVPPQLIKF